MICSCITALWNGIAWGDVGGWLSGLGTLLAVWVALNQAKQQRLYETQQRQMEMTARRKMLAMTFFQLALPIAHSSRQAWHQLMGGRYADTVAVFARTFTLIEESELLAMRPFFLELDVTTCHDINLLLFKVRAVNHALKNAQAAIGNDFLANATGLPNLTAELLTTCKAAVSFCEQMANLNPEIRNIAGWDEVEMVKKEILPDTAIAA